MIANISCDKINTNQKIMFDYFTITCDFATIVAVGNRKALHTLCVCLEP